MNLSQVPYLDTRPICVIILQEFEKESFLFNFATVVVSHKRARVRLKE